MLGKRWRSILKGRRGRGERDDGAVIDASRHYDRMRRGGNRRRYDENSGYFNFRYWAAGAKPQREASKALVDRTVARIANRTGRILDVACGPASNHVP